MTGYHLERSRSESLSKHVLIPVLPNPSCVHFNIVNLPIIDLLSQIICASFLLDFDSELLSYISCSIYTTVDA